MQSRFLKQLIYGSLYLAVWIGIGYLVYILALKPAPICFDGRQNGKETGVDCGGGCMPCALKSLKQIKVMPVALFDNGGGRLSALIELRNPNTNYGADPFSYKLVFYDSAGSEVSSIYRESFIYPGEIKYIVEAGIDLDISSVLRAGVELADFSWKPVSQLSLPDTGTRDVRVVFDPAAKRATVAGFMVNRGSSSLGEAEVNVLILDSSGAPAGISKTLLQSIQPFEEREFKAIVPNISLPSVAADSVKVEIEARR